MTYEPGVARDSVRVMRGLVILFIIWVAYWASTGGLDRLLAEDTTTVLLHTAI